MFIMSPKWRESEINSITYYYGSNTRFVDMRAKNKHRILKDEYIFYRNLYFSIKRIERALKTFLKKILSMFFLSQVSFPRNIFKLKNKMRVLLFSLERCVKFFIDDLYWKYKFYKLFYLAIVLLASTLISKSQMSRMQVKSHHSWNK